MTAFSLKDVDDFVYEKTGGVVQSGPFKGIRLLREQGWPSGALSPAFLGCHEQELHGPIEEEIKRLKTLSSPHVANVGSGEGYYAVGLAKRLPHAKVWAIDIADDCKRITAATAALNQVDLIIDHKVDECFESVDFVFMDCEGAERIYLDPEKYPALLKATIIVEIHNDETWKNDLILVDRLLSKFHIVAYFEAGRNPNIFDFLVTQPSVFKWMAICENRPCSMGWFVMFPRTR